MNFLKPTKPKILGTLVVWLAGGIEGWITTGFVRLFFPDFLTAITSDIGGFQEKLLEDNGFASAFFLSIFFSIVVKIILIYLAVCFFVHLTKKR